MQAHLKVVILCFFFWCPKGGKTNLASELVSNNNYPIEVHGNISTEDGYILTLHRIPHGVKKLNRLDEKSDLNLRNKKNPSGVLSMSKRNKREVVLLMAGLLGSAEHFLAGGPEKGLAYILADNGFDVWIGNARSTSYTRHLNYSRASNIFWNFTETELGIYDLSAFVNYVLNETNASRIQYVGHSQGAMSMFILCSERPEYVPKIKLFIGLAPAVYLNNVPHPWLKSLVEIEANGKMLSKTFELFGINMISLNENLRNIGYHMCQVPLIKDICLTIINVFAGITSAREFDTKSIHNLLFNAPEGLGIKQLIHLMQISYSGKFQKFDYGLIENKKIYGSNSPHTYKIENMKIPIAIYYSKADWFVYYNNSLKLVENVENCVDHYEIPENNFTHLDFIIHKDLVPLLYNRVLALMIRYKYK